MNKAVIHVEYGGKYVGKADKIRWDSKDAKVNALTFKEEISYSMLVDRICRKIGIDEGKTKVKLSYIPLVLKPPKVVEILDDNDVDGYVSTMDKNQCKSLLHVEVSQCEEVVLEEAVLGREDQSSVGLNNGKMDSNRRLNDGLVIRCEEADGNDGQIEHIDVRDGENVDENVVRDEFIDLLSDDEELGQQFVENWGDGPGLELGQQYVAKQQVQNLLLRASLKKCYEFDILNTDTWRYRVRCRADGCNWYLRLGRPQYSTNELWRVTKYTKMHSCSRASSSSTTNKRKGTPQLVADVIHEEYLGVLETPVLKFLMDLVLSKAGVQLSYHTALRGKNLDAAVVRGSPDDCYKKLPAYLYVLEKMNAGTKTSLLLDKEGRFKYLFIALGACIEGFRAMRKVITVDATFLKYGGVLIFAIAQDPNHHHYPIAFAVVDGEKDASWNWFFKELKRVVVDEKELVFVSDRNASLIKAIAEIYKLATHGYCVYHLSQNVRQHAPSGQKDYVGKKFRELAGIYTQVVFDKEYIDFLRRFPKVAEYLGKSVKVEKWARSYSKGARYNIETTNGSESMNNVFKKARMYALLPMIDIIVAKIAEWFNKHRKIVAKAPKTHRMVPVVENLLHPRCKTGSKLKVQVLNSVELEFTVIGEDGKTYNVDLKEKSCTCKGIDIDQIPCVHAIAAVLIYGKMEDRAFAMNVYDLCSEYFLLETWVYAYVRTIYTVPHESQWQIDESLLSKSPLPPDYPKKKGRYQENRFPSAGERPWKKRKTNNKCVPGRNLAELIGFPRRDYS